MKQQHKTILITLGAAASIILALLFINMQITPKGPQPGADNAQHKPAKPGLTEASAAPSEQTQSSLPEVGVLEVSLDTYQASVSGYAETSAQFALTLSAQVPGQIQHIASRFRTGEQFAENEVLATLDSTDYQQALDAADATLQEANVALEEERLQGLQAKDEWLRSGLDGEPDSPLVLRAPQLASAQAAVKQAKSALNTAKRDLSYTSIKAPFDALVVSREVQPGSFVQTGTEIATLYSTDIAEIAIPLSASQWQNLPAASTLNTTSWPVTLTDMDGTGQWTGHVTRIEQHLDSESRQRSAIVVVDKPLAQPEPLYFGTYVNVTITGRSLSDIWKIPSSAISQQQQVWYVTDHNTLAHYSPTVLFQKNGFAYVTPAQQMNSASIVIRPLSSYRVDTRVIPVKEQSDDN